MFGEFIEATKLKTSLAKYSIEFNDLAVQMRPHKIAYLRLLGRVILPYLNNNINNNTTTKTLVYGLCFLIDRILKF